MTLLQQSEQAMHNLILARLKGDIRNINYWLTRVDYYTEQVMQERLKK